MVLFNKFQSECEATASGNLTFGRHLIFAAAIHCLFNRDTLGMATWALREWLALRCSAGRAAKLVLHLHETSAPLMCTWNEIFRLHCSYLPSAKAHTTGWTTFAKSSYFIRIASS